MHKIYSEEENLFYKLKGSTSMFVDVANQHKDALAAMDYVIDKLDYIFANKIRLDKNLRYWLRKNIPYCFRGYFANRDYKDVGSLSLDWTDGLLSTKGWKEIIEPYRVEEYDGYMYFCFNNEYYRTGGDGYFFNDGSQPWLDREYLNRYRAVLKHIRSLL